MIGPRKVAAAEATRARMEPRGSEDVVYDMETDDPDDLIALCFLTAHPAVRLRAVTIVPGSASQVALVKGVLLATDHDHVPVGSFDASRDEAVVHPLWRDLLGASKPRQPDELAHVLLADVLSREPRTTLVTGGPLGNLAMLINHHSTTVVTRWVGQGGFVGGGGARAGPSHNFNRDVEAALAVLGSSAFARRELVGRNVTHGLVYDLAWHRRVQRHCPDAPGWRLILRAMEAFLERHPRGKRLHDPLAACVAVDSTVCEFDEVRVFRTHGGEWTSIPSPGSGIFAATNVDHERFAQIFLLGERLL